MAKALRYYETHAGLHPSATVILHDAALARPYCDLALHLLDHDSAAHAPALAAIYEWQAVALAAFAAMRPAAATIALVGRSEFCWPQVHKQAIITLPA